MPWAPALRDLTARSTSALTGVAMAVGLVAVPGPVSATTTPAAHIAPDRSGSALCNGVSAAAVSKVVGFTVPAPTATTTASTFDKALGIRETSTDCVYAHPNTAASEQREVTLDYESLSKAPPTAVAVAAIKAAFAKAEKSLSPGGKSTFEASTKSGVTTLFGEVTTKDLGASSTIEFDLGWKGTKVAGTVVLAKMTRSKLDALKQLALYNWDV